jgi:hypothetical protein
LGTYEGGKLTLGSGLFVGPTGIACDHHFNPHRCSDFHYVEGGYRIEIFVVPVGKEQSTKLMEVAFTVGVQSVADFVRFKDMALFLEWNADRATMTKTSSED